LAGGDEWFELAASCDVCVGVTAGVAACLRCFLFFAALMREGARQSQRCPS
jgi:hypothetical protein